MMHPSRVWKVGDVEDLDELIAQLTDRVWTTCTGFRWRSLLLLNDATGENGAQEYAVLRNGRQVESLTCSWMRSPAKQQELRSILRRLDADPVGYWGGPAAFGQYSPRLIQVNLNHPAGTCPACQ